jgi:hypothetical protein
LIYPAKTAKDFIREAGRMKKKDECGSDHLQFDAQAVSILQSVFNCPDSEDFMEQYTAIAATLDGSGTLAPGQALVHPGAGPAVEEGFSTTASVKFMITRQDEISLRERGYSQAQIDRLRPQEVSDILAGGTEGGTGQRQEDD